MNTREPRVRVLVVDDEPGVRTWLANMLDKDYDVTLCADAGAAREALQRDAVQVIVCDHMMPGENGLDFCQWLHLGHHPAVRIMITGHNERALLVDALNSQALFRFLVKPFSRHEFLQVVQDAEAHHERQQQESRLLEKGVRMMLEESASVNRSGRIGRSIIALGGFGLAVAVSVIALATLLALLALLALYLLKTWLGIDIFKDSHLVDFL